MLLPSSPVAVPAAVSRHPAAAPLVSLQALAVWARPIPKPGAPATPGLLGPGRGVAQVVLRVEEHLIRVVAAPPPQCQILPLPIPRYRLKFQINLVWDLIKPISNFAFNLAKQNKLKIHNKGTVDLYPNPTAPCILTRR